MGVMLTAPCPNRNLIHNLRNRPIPFAPPVCTSNNKTSDDNLAFLAATLRSLSADDRFRLAAMLVETPNAEEEDRP
jgi:hypothetical protein